MAYCDDCATLQAEVRELNSKLKASEGRLGPALADANHWRKAWTALDESYNILSSRLGESLDLARTHQLAFEAAHEQAMQEHGKRIAAESRLDSAIGALTECHQAVPGSWLDELLSGPNALKIDNTGNAVEKLLNRIRDRISAVIQPHVTAHNDRIVETPCAHSWEQTSADTGYCKLCGTPWEFVVERQPHITEDVRRYGKEAPPPFDLPNVYDKERRVPESGINDGLTEQQLARGERSGKSP